MSAEFVLAGLGNPGPRYELTRHNVGFLALDFIAGKSSVWKKISDAEGQECDLAPNQRAALIKPMTFMNLSGKITKIEQCCLFKKLEDLLLIAIRQASCKALRLKIK